MARQKNLLRPGDVFAQKYVILGVLGEGGMGVVYEAEHTMLAQRVAIKMLKDFAKESDEFLKRFGREARASARLRGAHVARVHDVDLLPDGTPYMVLEYLDGHCLGSELDARGRLPIAEAANYTLEACSAMAEAHAYGIIHRDLKPSNLYFSNQKDGTRILKVLDFGISKSAIDDEVSVTMTQSSLGTPMYMSPEQIRSAKHVDRRTDIWSLGVILYEMLVGHGPFDGESPSAIIAAVASDPVIPPREKRPEIPEELEAIVMRALEKKAEDRFESIEEFAEALLPFAATPDVWAPASTQPNRGSLPSFPGVGSMDVTLVESADLVDVTDGVRPAQTADPTRTAESAGANRATMQTFTSDSAAGARPSSTKKRVAVAAGIAAAAVAGYLVFGGGASTNVTPATAPEATSAAPPVAPAPSMPPPEVAPALTTADAAPAASVAPPAPSEPKPPKVHLEKAAPAVPSPLKKTTPAVPAAPPPPAPEPKPTPTKRHPLTL